MWSNVHLAAHLAWETVLWSATAIWADDPSAPPVVLETSGQTPLGEDDSPAGILYVAVCALQRDLLEKSRQPRIG